MYNIKSQGVKAVVHRSCGCNRLLHCVAQGTQRQMLHGPASHPLRHGLMPTIWMNTPSNIISIISMHSIVVLLWTTTLQTASRFHRYQRYFHTSDTVHVTTFFFCFLSAKALFLHSALGARTRASFLIMVFTRAATGDRYGRKAVKSPRRPNHARCQVNIIQSVNPSLLSPPHPPRQSIDSSVLPKIRQHRERAAMRYCSAGQGKLNCSTVTKVRENRSPLPPTLDSVIFHLGVFDHFTSRSSFRLLKASPLRTNRQQAD